MRMLQLARPHGWCLSAIFGSVLMVSASAGSALAQTPPSVPAPHRTATTLKQLQDIVHGTNGVAKIAAGQCVQLNDGNYLNDSSGIANNPGQWLLQNVSFSPGITIRTTTRRYKGYGSGGGITTGGAITKKLLLLNSSGITLDGIAMHRGNTGTLGIREPAIHVDGASKITFRCMEFYGYKPTGTEANWKSMQYNDTYNQQWNLQPTGIRRHGGTTSNMTVEHCYFHFLGLFSVGLEFCPNSVVRNNLIEYVSGDGIKFEQMNGSTFESNIMWKFFPTVGSDGDVGHSDGYQSTSTNQAATTNCTFRKNLIMDRGRGKLQGIFAEQDGNYTGPKGMTIEDNIVFIGTGSTGPAISIPGKGAGNNKIRNNTVLVDIHGSTTSNPNVIIWLNSVTGTTGNEVMYNVSDNYSVTGPATRGGDKTMSETTYLTHLQDYGSGKTAIEGLTVNGVFQPAVLRRLSWKVGSTLYDPNKNGGAGAWKAFQAFGATPSGWTPPGGTSPTGNLALNRPATSSSNENTTNTAAKAFDGSTSTRWASTPKVDPQWIRVDLGSSKSIGKVVLKWEAAYAKSYKIQTSTDGTTWSDRFSTTTGDGGTDTITFAATSARYVRMYGTVRFGSTWGYSLWEFEVYAN